MTRANTERPTGARGMERPKAGGEHSDALEGGLPSDTPSEGRGHSDEGTGYKPDGKNALERGAYPGVETGNQKGAGGPEPGTAKAQGVPSRNATGDGRGNSGKFKGTMGGGAPDGGPGLEKCKGAMGNC